MRRAIQLLTVALTAVGFLADARAEMQPGTAVVRALDGAATYVDASGAEKPLAVGLVLREGDTVKTAADSRLDLLLPHNGPDVGLGPEGTLHFARLRYQESELGMVKETVLDVPRGEIFGHVDPLVGDSKYLVRSPKGTVEVKGTDFWYDALTGNVHVLTGQVFLTVNFDVDSTIPPYGGDTSDLDFSRVVVINAGQSFFMPRGSLYGATFTAVNTPPGTTPGWFWQHFTDDSPVSLVETSYHTELSIDPINQFSRVVVAFPPTLISVSP